MQHFGLGPETKADEITITWPSGAVTHLADLPGGKRCRIVEGQAS